MRKLIKRLILFLVRKYMGLSKYELFRFSNQKSPSAVYYFGDNGLTKTWITEFGYINMNRVKSSVSLNWLLDDDCKIEKYVMG